MTETYSYLDDECKYYISLYICFYITVDIYSAEFSGQIAIFFKKPDGLQYH